MTHEVDVADAGQGNLPVYVQAVMYCCTYSALAMTFCVCVIPVITLTVQYMLVDSALDSLVPRGRVELSMSTNNRGEPHGWVQDGMYMAKWTVLSQVLKCSASLV